MFAPDPHAVNRELDRLVASNALKGSKRSQEFLRHVVEAALRGETDRLKERTLGVALFQRPADYDTSEDAIVRVKANEVRRRLAQAYQELGPAPEVEIALPAGSYVPEFRVVEGVGGEELPGGSARASGRSKWLWGGAACAVLIAAALAAARLWGADPAREFWRPVLAAEGVVRICVSLEPEDHVDVGEARAAARLAAYFAETGKAHRIVTEHAGSTPDERRSPAVLLGRLARLRSHEGQIHLRYVFRDEDGAALIEDTEGKGQRWVSRGEGSSADYALITRLVDAPTGRPVVLASGLGPAATQAAGEWLADKAALNAMLGKVEGGWQRRNLQLVLRVGMRGASPSKPELIAAHAW